MYPYNPYGSGHPPPSVPPPNYGYPPSYGAPPSYPPPAIVPLNYYQSYAPPYGQPAQGSAPPPYPQPGAPGYPQSYPSLIPGSSAPGQYPSQYPPSQQQQPGGTSMSSTTTNPSSGFLATPAPATGYPPAAPPPVAAGPRRKALLIGCSYPGTSSRLNGCINDVTCMKYLLKSKFGMTDSQIVTLKDDVMDANYTPYKHNIFKGIHWLMTDLRAGDRLFFHFSGHGSQRRDRGGDEEDGYDETICPTDYATAGQIVDDELNAALVRPLPPGVTLHAVIDACHSGTALDLPFSSTRDSRGYYRLRGAYRPSKATFGGMAFQFGACKDSQVAQDTSALSSGRVYTGAATFCFIQAIEKYGVQQTYGQILAHMEQVLHATTGGGGGGGGGAFSLSGAAGLLGQLLTGLDGDFTGTRGQTPVLSCDREVDINATPFMF